MSDEITRPFPDDPEEMPDEIWDRIHAYLNRKGTIELLAHLSMQKPEAHPYDVPGYQFNELEEMMDLSPGTLSRRLDEGQNLQMIEADIDREDGKNKQKYSSKGIGRDIGKAAVRLGVPELYRQLTSLKEDLDNRRSELISAFEQGGKQGLAEAAPIFSGDVSEYVVGAQTSQDAEDTDGEETNSDPG
jgi:DNA-binding HxlR family transcriptional regulator